MKKNHFWITLVVVVILGAFLISGVELEIVSSLLDVDGDGDIDIYDVRAVYNQIPDYDVQYDVDEDDDVDIYDVREVYENIGNTPGETSVSLDWDSNVIWS